VEAGESSVSERACAADDASIGAAVTCTHPSIEVLFSGGQLTLTPGLNTDSRHYEDGLRTDRCMPCIQ